MGGRGASSSNNNKINIKDRSNEWQYKRDEKGKVIGYKLSKNIEIRKDLNLSFDGPDSYDNGLYVNGKYIMSAGSGYTIPYLKKLGGLYQDALDSGIKDPQIYYSDLSNEIIIRDRKTKKEYYNNIKGK